MRHYILTDETVRVEIYNQLTENPFVTFTMKNYENPVVDDPFQLTYALKTHVKKFRR